MADEQRRKEINKSIVKPLAVTAGILGLAQGIAWTIFSVLCICSYTGSLQVDLSVNETKYYKLIYALFLDARYRPNNTIFSVIVYPKDFFIFNWFYLVFSAVWTGISGAIVWAMIHDKWNLAKKLFGTWSGTTILISILDIVLAGLLISDYVSVNDSKVLTKIIVTYGIVMSLAARGYVLWVINVIFALILMKFTVDIMKRENKASTMNIIHGYDNNDVHPPWFNGSVKDFWVSPQRTPYDNPGFERSGSFFPLPNGITPGNMYNEPPITNRPPPITIVPNNNPPPMTIIPNNNPPPISFSEAIAQRTATIGRNKGRRSPPNHVPPPVIPDPDYTPPSSPNGLKSVLRSKSNYNVIQ